MKKNPIVLTILLIFPIFSAQDNFMGVYFEENQSVSTNCFDFTETVFEEFINTQQGLNNADFSWYNIFSTQHLFNFPNL